MANLAATLKTAKAPLEVHEVDTYTPGPREILVKNEVIGLNAVESKIAKLGIMPLDYPAILGSTFAGTVQAVGSEVTHPRIGQRVVVSKRFGVAGNQYGAYQRYVVVKDEMLSVIPGEMDPIIPASLMMNLTCVVGLFTGRAGLERPHLKESGSHRDGRVLIYGGSSSFGSLSIQYLSQAGYTVVTTSSPRNHDFVSKLAAAAIFDPTVDADKLVNDLIAAGPYDIIVDMISLTDTLTVNGRVLAAHGGGKLYVMQPVAQPKMFPKGVTPTFEPWSESLYEERNVSLREWVLREYLPQGLLDGAITPLPVEKVPGGLGGINRALDRMQSGISGVKLIVDPWE